MTKQELTEQIKKKRSFLCIGLDTDRNKIPKHFLQTADPVFEFNKAIIDATHEFAVAYKPNLAFYERYGVNGWQSLTRTEHYLRQFDVFTIADAKRGDIGNTSQQYARAFFCPEEGGLDFDAVTIAPYMGEDSVKPFLEFQNKWVILLALTSNKGAEDFQMLTARETDYKFFEEVLIRSLPWGTESNMMYVVGATKAENLQTIRHMVPDHFLLVPGIGAQGGSLEDVAEYGLTRNIGLLVNASRSIIYASDKTNFAQEARDEASKLQKEMERIMIQRRIL